MDPTRSSRLHSLALRLASIPGRRLRLLVLALLLSPAAAAVDLRYDRISVREPIVDIRHAGDGTGRLFLVGQDGRVFVLRDGQEQPLPFLDIRDRVGDGGERGLLSLAFAPDYADSGALYTWYTRLDGDTVLSRFRVSGNPDRADPDSEEQLLVVPQPQGNHNGGQLRFGPDGYLYLGLGDGGGAGDPQENGQDLNTLLGSLIRLHVDPDVAGYRVPDDNPLVGRPGRDEAWAWGLRNPWRIAFDALNGDLFIADVGQGSYEEINVQPLLQGGGQNYGWNRTEGNECYRSGCDDTGLTPPVGGYSHAQGCSVTGGVVYRGSAYPDLDGTYLFGDYCSGRIWGLSRDAGGWRQDLLDNSAFRPLTFGTGEDGAVYLSAQGLGVYRLSDGAPQAETPFAINPALNDAWFREATAGQGFFFTVYPDRRRLFIAWFTFDSERPMGGEGVLGDAGQRWFTAIGPYGAGQAQLEVSVTEGGVFDASSPGTETRPVGTLMLGFTACNRAMATYRFPALEIEGQIALERVSRDNVALCEALSRD